MKKYLVLLIALLVAGPLLASNMGFKLNMVLKGPDAYTGSGDNWISLPSFFMTNPMASDLATDMANSGITVTQISKFDPITKAFTDYLPDLGFDDFAVTPSTSILVKIDPNGGDKTWIVVGSHNDAATYTLYRDDAYSGTADNWISVPYHETATTASALATELDTAFGAGSIAQISKFDPVTKAFTDYLPDLGFDDFNITAGQGVLIKVSPTASGNLSWVPAHY